MVYYFYMTVMLIIINNDLDLDMKNEVLKFTDDTKLFGAVTHG